MRTYGVREAYARTASSVSEVRMRPSAAEGSPLVDCNYYQANKHRNQQMTYFHIHTALLYSDN